VSSTAAAPAWLDRANPLPLYAQLRDALLDEIRDGGLAPGDRFATEAVIQERSPKDRLSFVITVEPVSETVMRRALAAIDRFDFMLECAVDARRAVAGQECVNRKNCLLEAKHFSSWFRKK
jgi:hypothetical protein